jgi:hypothetical protein
MANRRKKDRSKRRLDNRNAVKGGTTRLSTPRVKATSETAKGASGNGLWTLRQDTKGMHLPDALIEATGAERSAPGSFMLLIVALAVIFIATITWFVSNMPEK